MPDDDALLLRELAERQTGTLGHVSWLFLIEVSKMLRQGGGSQSLAPLRRGSPPTSPREKA